MVEAAHTLKGSAGTLGAVRLQEQCRELEEGVREHGVPDGTVHLDEIAAELDRVHAALDRALGAHL
jgi:HPt (histidine-containing phosphotransfer) domain-containing protein